jgi:hypothetical protein
MPARAVVVFAGIFVALGCTLAVQTARVGGGIGYALAALFVALGVGRIYLLWSRRKRD